MFHVKHGARRIDWAGGLVRVSRETWADAIGSEKKSIGG
jgi:hypothetical protein